VENGDVNAAFHHIHRIKGAARTMEVESIFSVASELEHALLNKSGNLNALLQRLRKVLSEFSPPFC
uniref:Hpt domain-containing protein n=1 Tax=Chromobacterium sp. ASV23 TaxID=2795110 RepID=UPI0018ED96D4